MHKKEKFYYSETDEVQVLGLPYEGNDVLMYVVLPKERFGLENVLKNLSGKSLLNLVQNRAKEEVIVSDRSACKSFTLLLLGESAQVQTGVEARAGPDPQKAGHRQGLQR